jgi:UDP-GlcNAc:undecaprenyl-phosphate/decaprenyl-phosphate GlcNAc-1-phosphate transferase
MNLYFVKIIPIILMLPISFFLTKLANSLAKKTRFLSDPNPIVESHKVPIAYGGGAAIGLTIIIFLIFQSGTYQNSSKFILILIPVIAVGLLDDIFRFSPGTKLLFQIISTLPFLIFYINASILVNIIFMLFILLSQNAWNLIDIMDGLLSGVSFIVFISVGIILLPIIELEFYSVLSFSIAFSVIGFRFLNKSPAKIFLGETGSLLLGSLFAFIIINVFLFDKITALFLMLLGIVPYFELFFLIIVRSKKGIPFYKGSPDHFALRMLNTGLSVQSINKRVILACFIYSLIIVVINFLTPDISTLTTIICLSLIVTNLGYLYFENLPAKELS